MMQIPVEPVLALLGGLIILFNEKGLRDVAAAYLLWVAATGLAPIVKAQLGV
ncbi:MAG: DUF3096 domain-containing protein [Neomegalonema sp.]